jgi:formate dehydrogenase iron-sulfur subunit
LTPACAQACPTQSIRFGPINKLRKDANVRLAQLRQQGMTKAELYGADDKVLGGLNAFYLLPDKPEVFGLPPDPKLPSRSVARSAFWSIFTAFMTALGVLFTFRNRTRVAVAPAIPGNSPEPILAAPSSPGPLAKENPPAKSKRTDKPEAKS